ncbi:hypothetical protein [Geomonas edaphica]|uniref:hypothetical protein n=1 Tax=Geomonas edaphica TaxID=2570226 RepID=UPI001FE4F916|nr:hypothetical protein [Geomonas edaphica]
MLAVEKWAQNKAPFIALVAPSIAAFARELPDMFRNLKMHQLANHKATLPHLPMWYDLYKNHRQYCEPFQKMLVDSSALAEQLIAFGSSVKELAQNKEELNGYKLTEADLAEGQLFWKELLDLSFHEMRFDFGNLPLDNHIAANFELYLSKHKMELSFVFLVFTPCFILYKMSPSKLYHKARIGDVSSIDKILRIDPLMLHDPAIGYQIQKIRLSGKLNTYQNLVDAPLKPIKAKLTNGKIKASMATLISIIADGIKQPLTSIEIRNLFDAVAQDADKRDIDTCLPDSPEALSKSIQRKRSSWQPLLSPDSKKSK